MWREKENARTIVNFDYNRCLYYVPVVLFNQIYMIPNFIPSFVLRFTSLADIVIRIDIPIE